MNNLETDLGSDSLLLIKFSQVFTKLLYITF
jgi:hypothetical protein